MVNHGIIQRVKKDMRRNSDEISPRDETSLSRFWKLRKRLVHQTLLPRNEIEEPKKTKERFEGYRTLSERLARSSFA